MSEMQNIGLEKLRTLIEISGLINSNYTDVSALLIHILKSAMRLVECESSSILLKNNINNTLRFVVALGPKGAEAKNIIVDGQSIAGWVSSNQQALIIDDVAKDPRFFKDVQVKTGYISSTMIAVPMMCQNKECIGVIELINKAGKRKFIKEDLITLELFCNQACIAIQNASVFQNAQNTITVLQDNIHSGSDYHDFVSKSVVIQDLLHVIDEVAKTNSSVLITGESGVGKELFAEQVHLRSDRRNKKFVRVNCAALAPQLLESELFGHVRGAFTNAVNDRKGRFEVADGGTIFLDEIGELPLETQVKLLRVIQNRKFEKVGSSDTISVDVRIVVATNRDLELMVEEKKFREDLYYRLNVLPIHIPPLRERKEDIAPLCNYFLKKFSGETKKNFEGFSTSAKTLLINYYWPGNVRELENAIERACVLGEPPYIKSKDLLLKIEKKQKDQASITSAADECLKFDVADRTLKTAMNKFKKLYVKSILDETSWNQTEASKILGIQRTYVSRLMNELHIRG